MSVNTMNGQQRRQQTMNDESGLVQKKYRTALTELTFNSKPIITNLTIMAQENQSYAGDIVKEIENRLRINTAGQKLPILYLIDSICKNVGGIYISVFGINMVNTFLDAYTCVDQNAKAKSEKLLKTWKNGLPGGRPVFARNVIEPIEKSIAYYLEKQQIASNTIHVNPNFINKDKHVQASSRDPRTKNIAPPLTQPVKQEPTPPSSINSVLSQLKLILPQQSQQLQPQLQAYQMSALNISDGDPVKQLIDQIQAILPTLSPVQANPIEQYISQIASSIPTTTIAANTTTTTSVIPPNHGIASPILTINSISPSLNKSSIIHTPSPPKVDTADLLKSLTSMGYLGPTKDDTPTLESMGPFSLDSKDLQKSRPGAIELLYSAEPLQCKQCGFRYPKTEQGQKKMDSHLDSHFRQNRKMKERVKRGLSRSWFVTVDEWVHGEGGESMSQQVPTFLQDGMGNVNKSNEGNNTNEEIINPDNYTVIKQTDEKRTCPICGETFASFWSDEEEEWMFKNAILEAHKIYHATCHTDAVKTQNLLDSADSKRKSEAIDLPESKHQRIE